MRALLLHFIKYPVAVNVVIAAVVVLGWLGMKSMKSSFFPLQDSKIIGIQITYPGASPEEMEEGIVLKIENNLRGIVGVERFTSSSSENAANIQIEAKKGHDIDLLLAEVKNAVDKVPSFPTEMDPPVVSKVENLTRGVAVAISGENLPLEKLKEIGRQIEDEVRSLEGISQVTLSGFPAEEISISVSEDQLRAFNLTFSEVSNAVEMENIIVTGGSIKTVDEDYLIRVSNREYYGKEMGNIPVKTNTNGAIVRLSDVADIQDTWSEVPDKSAYNGRPSLTLEILTTNNEDLISAADRVEAFCAEWNLRGEPVKMDVVFNASILIKQRTELLLKNGLQGVILVILLLGLFLRPRLALWVAFGIPISFLGMFIFLGWMGVTINVLSLFGMIIVVGILVDDGIVIAENIFYHFENGKTPIQAALDGTMEVLPAVISAVLTTLVAFSTFFFLDGRIGEFFPDVSIVVILTLSVSLLEAFITLPAHVAHSKALDRSSKPFWFNVWGDRLMQFMIDRLYTPAFRFSMAYKPIVVAALLALFMVTMGALSGGTIKSTFFPVITSDRVNVSLRMPQGTNPAITDSIITSMEAVAWRVNEEFTAGQMNQKQVFLNIIRDLGPGSANASLEINLLPGEERNCSSDEIATALSEAVGPVNLAESVIYDSGSNFGGKPISVSLLSYNISDLKGAKDKLKRALRENALLRNISDSDPAGLKEIRLRLKPRAYIMGYRLNDVIKQVRAGFNGLQAQRFQRGRDEIIVWVRYNRTGRSSINDLNQMHITGPGGARAPLSEIADYSIQRGELSIAHIDGEREIKVEADLKNPKEGANAVVADIRNNIMPAITSEFPTVSALYEGQNREAQKVKSSAGKVIGIILFLMFLIMAFTFRTMLKPILLLMLIPFCLIAVAWGHWLHNFPINVLSFLGIIALIGIAVNDGLVYIEKFHSLLKEGVPFEEALERAGRLRFRAIFLTSVTTIAGLAPLILEKSRQAQFLIPMAISIAYGIALGTLLTLLVLPILLSAANRMQQYLIYLWEGKKPVRESIDSSVIEMESDQYENL